MNQNIAINLENTLFLSICMCCINIHKERRFIKKKLQYQISWAVFVSFFLEKNEFLKGAVVPIVISVDPDRDTVSQIRKYKQGFI